MIGTEVEIILHFIDCKQCIKLNELSLKRKIHKEAVKASQLIKLLCLILPNFTLSIQNLMLNHKTSQ